MLETEAFSSFISSGVNVTEVAPTFWIMGATCVVPGIGTIHGFCAISQARHAKERPAIEAALCAAVLRVPHFSEPFVEHGRVFKTDWLTVPSTDIPHIRPDVTAALCQTRQYDFKLRQSLFGAFRWYSGAF
jgi:hypothetical protein